MQPSEESSDWAESVRPDWDDALAQRKPKKAVKRAASPVVSPPPKRARLAPPVCERKERDTRNGTFSLALDDLYRNGGDAAIHSLRPGLSVDELPDFMDFMISENEDGTGHILCLTEPIDEVEFTEADAAYGFLLCILRSMGVLQL